MEDKAEFVDALQKEHGPIALNRSRLAELERAFDTVRRVDTCFAGEILVLEGSGVIFAVEFPPDRKDELVARVLRDREHADAFIEERMAVYDRMWDGCGCRVNYYEK